MKSAFNIFFLFCATTVLAQNNIIAISNLGQTSAGSGVVYSNQNAAMSFTTSNLLTILSTVSVSMLGGGRLTGSLGTFQVAIYNDSNGSPGSSLMVLSGNGYPTNTGIYSYTNTSTLLLATNTPYWIVFSSSKTALSAQYKWRQTSSTALDANSSWALGVCAVGSQSKGWTIQSGQYLQFSITVNTNVDATPLIASLPVAAAITYGQALTSSSLSGGAATNLAGAIVAGSFVFTTPSTMPAAGMPSESVAFTPTDANDYITITIGVPVPVTQQTPSIASVPIASAITYSQTLAKSILSNGAATNAAGATLVGSFAFTSPSTAPVVGTPSESVTFTPADTNDYRTVTCSVPVPVTQATPLIAIAPSATPIIYGQTVTNSTLIGGVATNSVGARVGGSFAFTTPPTEPPVGTPREPVTFTPTDTTNYTTANLSVPVSVSLQWTQASNAPARQWLSVAASADGTKLVASELTGGSIYVSTNSGVGWTQTTAPKNREWESVASSADGTDLAAVDASDGVIYTSTNSGANWTACNPGPFEEWRAIASSADGKKLAAVASSDSSGNPVPISISADLGNTWTTTGPSNDWTAVCSSADGTKLAATVFDGPIYTSLFTS